MSDTAPACVIENPRLQVEQIPDRPGRRLITVSYDLVVTDPADHRPLVTERIVVHGIDHHDAPVEPTKTPLLEHESVLAATTGSIERVVEEAVSRYTLDVERDWWRNDLDGAIQPIAEWVDHIVAEISLSIDGHVIGEARTDVVTGSWGALGKD